MDKRYTNSACMEERRIPGHRLEDEDEPQSFSALLVVWAGQKKKENRREAASGDDEVLDSSPR